MCCQNDMKNLFLKYPLLKITYNNKKTPLKHKMSIQKCLTVAACLAAAAIAQYKTLTISQDGFLKTK